jgi:chromatin remodeling complex protein RSC6
MADVNEIASIENDSESTEVIQPTLDVTIKLIETQTIELKKLIVTMQNHLRLAKKQAFVATKMAAKMQNKAKRRKNTDGPPKISGSPELKEFMQLSCDAMKSRTEVTKWLCMYIQEHQLQGEKDRRFICFNNSDAGAKLKSLLKCDKEFITYFDLQHYLKSHISSKANPLDETTDGDAAGPSAAAEVVVPVSTSAAAEVVVPVSTSAAAEEAPVKRRVAVRPRPQQPANA